MYYSLIIGVIFEPLNGMVLGMASLPRFLIDFDILFFLTVCREVRNVILFLVPHTMWRMQILTLTTRQATGLKFHHFFNYNNYQIWNHYEKCIKISTNIDAKTSEILESKNTLLSKPKTRILSQIICIIV